MDLAGLYPAPTAASSSSLALVSRLLDITRSEQWRDLVAARGAAAETLEGKEKRRAKVATNLRLVEGFVSLMRVLADGGTALLARACAGFAEEVAGIRGKLQGELKGQVRGEAVGVFVGGRWGLLVVRWVLWMSVSPFHPSCTQPVVTGGGRGEQAAGAAGVPRGAKNAREQERQAAGAR